MSSKLIEILSRNTPPRNESERDIIMKIRNNQVWMMDTKLLSEIYDYMDKTDFVLTGWSYMMWSKPIYSFEERKVAESSLEYHSKNYMQPSLRGVTHIEDLSKYLKI